MISRLQKLYSTLHKKGLDALLISHPPNITYLTKYQSRDSYLLASFKKNHYFTDGRYLNEAKISLKNCADIKQVDGSVFRIIAKSCSELGLKRVGFEERILPFAEYKKIHTYLGKGRKLIATHGIVEESRQYKEPEEIRKIKKAVQISAEAIRFIAKFIKPATTELQVAAELERFIRSKGAAKASFDTIVASGPNSSYPHHITSKRKLLNNEPVLIDMGVEYECYKSDLTRVFFLGKMKALVKKVYSVVLEAQKRALENIQSGKKANEIDAIARQYITQHGFGGYFSHSLGHGVGLESHEEPHISAKSNNTIAETMIFTIEPAVYLPGKFGIRIEDMVLVNKENCEVLSGAVNK